ncbi:MAG TPA: DNA-processing protein DprA [Solirubrobacterales bacterium]
MSEPRACPQCLRRSWLLALLGPYIEQSYCAAPGPPTSELLRLGNEGLAAAVAPKVAAHLLARVEAMSGDQLERELFAARCWGCCHHHPLYPQALRELPDAPWALIGRGDHKHLEKIARDPVITVVGTRRASPYGREVARELGRELAASEKVVVSGLAFGIDSCAHRGALESGLTVAVLGCGADTAYPAAHRPLWHQICERGLVISEFSPGTPPWRWAFPARSRIMAALAGMTVVVEAAEHSGSLVTARIATDLGRDLGAVPGPVNARCSVGTNDLLAKGATVVRNAQDVLEAMGARPRLAVAQGQALDPVPQAPDRQ